MQDVELDGAGPVSKVTNYALGARGIDGISVTTSSGTSVSYPIYDAHGNMISMLAKNGSGYTYSAVRTFDAWGNIRVGAQTGDPKGRYCASLGHKQDDESGLVYMRARYYEPSSGRFASEDRIGNGRNWFEYCLGDPVNHSDSDGKRITDELIYSLFGSLGHGMMFCTFAFAFSAAYVADPKVKVDLLTKAAATMGLAVALYGCALGLGTDCAAKGLQNQLLLYSALGSTIIGMIPAFVVGLSAAATAGVAAGAIIALSIQSAICMGELFAQEVEAYN